MATNKWRYPKDMYESNKQYNEQVERDRFDEAHPPDPLHDNIHDSNRRHNEEMRRNEFDRKHKLPD